MIVSLLYFKNGTETHILNHCAYNNFLQILYQNCQVLKNIQIFRSSISITCDLSPIVRFGNSQAQKFIVKKQAAMKFRYFKKAFKRHHHHHHHEEESSEVDDQNIESGAEEVKPCSWRDYLGTRSVSFDAFQTLKQAMAGTLVTPFSGVEFTKARKQKFPLIIAYCQDVADVVLVVKFASEQNLRLNASGGVVVDVTLIDGIAIDPNELSATIGGGVTWDAFHHALDAFGLHTPGGASSTSVAWLGYGCTSRRWGLPCDNLLQLRLVTANGAIITANADENTELFWAHRCGGVAGSFGVIVELTFKLHELKSVLPISLHWPIESAVEVLHALSSLDRQLGLVATLSTRLERELMPDGRMAYVSTPFVEVRGVFMGDSWQHCKTALKPLLEIGSPSLSESEPVPYVQLKELLDDKLNTDVEKGTRRAGLIGKACGRNQLQQVIDYFQTAPHESNKITFEPFGGAISDVEPSDTAFVHRDTVFNVLVDSFWNEEASKLKSVSWLCDLFESSKTSAIWFLQYHPAQHLGPNHFGANYSRLQEVKTRWDPKNSFRFDFAPGIEPLTLNRESESPERRERPTKKRHKTH